ncbi:MAG: inositol 2-dehydrogenase [Chloroflexi bacterium]|nr:MAG: inositol 2-dehydrogenase [Chloroflexota bacterium]
MTLNIGVIGAGRIGKLHAENLVYHIPQAKVNAIVDISLNAAQDTATRLGIPNVSDDPATIFEDASIDAVVICSSTDTHAQFIIEAARAGKPVFCEKPIDHSLEKIDAALQAVEQAGVPLQIGFNRRFDPNYARVRQAVIDGEIGTPQLLHIISRDPSPPPIEYVKVSGGIFLDMTIHDFDMARFLIGSEVEEVYTAAGVMVDPAIGEVGDLDTAIITLKFSNGVIGTIDNSRQAVYGYDQRVEVFGSGGAIRTQNNYPNTATIQTAQSVYRDLPLHFFIERYTESYIIELQAFIDALVNDTPVPVSGLDGRVPVVMGLAARKSFDENRPVRLNEII